MNQIDYNLVKDEYTKQQFVIKSDCIWKNEFISIIGKYTFVSGGEESVVIVYSTINKINEFYRLYPQCTKEYAILHPLIKVFYIKIIDM